MRYSTRLIISLYNLINYGKPFKLIRNLYGENNNVGFNSAYYLKDYLSKWGRNTNIHSNHLMNKEILKGFIDQVNKRDVHKYIYTGGSTGEPLKVPFSKERSLRRLASVLYYNRIAGYNFGDKFLLIRSKSNSKLNQWLRNEIAFVPNDLSVTNLEYISQKIIKSHVPIIIGYPSVVYEIALFLKSHPELLKKNKIKSYISNSEPLDDTRRNMIKETFNCNIYDRYAAEEVGVIAQQYEYGGNLIVDRSNLYVEVLNPISLLPVSEGETGKVVITDISSDLFPIIRYDTEDFAEVAENKEGKLYSIKRIHGRIMDQFYKTDGTHFSPLSLGPFIRIPLTNLNLYFKFQFAQLSLMHFELRIKASEKLPDNTKHELIEGLKSVLGELAKIDIKIVDEIKPKPSGKRPLYVNEMENK